MNKFDYAYVWQLLFLWIICSGFLFASYGGQLIDAQYNSTVQAYVDDLLVNVTVKNSGSGTWYGSMGYPSWICKLIWAEGGATRSVTRYVYSNVAPGSNSSASITLAEADIPDIPGTYSYVQLYTYYPESSYPSSYFNMSGSPITIQFTVTPGITQYTISGTIQDSAAYPISGVEMTGLPGNPTTNSSGIYSATVAEGWSGTVTPSKLGHTFSPSVRTYSNVSSNQINQNYTGTPVPITISGQVLDSGGNGVEGVTILFTNGGNPAVTSAGGYYSTTVDYGYTGTATPQKDNFTFNPPSRQYSVLTSDQINQSYTAQLISAKVWGYIYAPYADGRLQGVTMQGFPDLVTTDAYGYYEAHVPLGWSGTVRPELHGYIFKTTNAQDYLIYENVQQDVTWQNYGSYVHADLTRDGEVNLLDYSAFAANWMRSDCNLSNRWCEYADINRDGEVELADFIEFADLWMDGICSFLVGLHQGKTDPIAQGWAWEEYEDLGSSVNTGPISKGAWFVQNNTVGTPPDWGVFQKELTPLQIATALDSTWTLSVRLAVTEPTTNNTGGIWAGFSTGTTRYGLNFTRDEHGIQRVECPVPGGAQVSHEFSDYQLIQLIGQGPVVSLYIDGILKQTNYLGYDEPDAIGIMWGDNSSFTTGRGDFNLVSFSIGSEEIVIHEGSTHPLTEGWIWHALPGSTTTYGPSQIMSHDAWCVSDTTTALNSWGRYRMPITDEQALLANLNGWTLSIRAKVAAETQNGQAIMAEFRDTTTRYTLDFQKDAIGVQTVRCGLGSGQWTTPVPFEDFELIELRGKDGMASLYVGGIQMLTDYVGDHEVAPKQIDWGSSSSLGTGICYWNLVKFEINP